MLIYLLAFTEDRIIAAVTNDTKELTGLAIKNMFSFNDLVYSNGPNVNNTILSENATKLGDFLKMDSDNLLSSNKNNFAIAYSDISRGALVQSRNSIMAQVPSKIMLITPAKNYEFMLMGISKPSITYQPYTIDDNTFNGYVETVNRFLGDKIKVLRASDPIKVPGSQLFGALFKRKNKGSQQTEGQGN
jgi:hypothetical protein